MFKIPILFLTYNRSNYTKKVIKAILKIKPNKIYISSDGPKKTDLDKMNNILHISLDHIAKIAILLNPIIPLSTTKVLDALNLKTKDRNLSFLESKTLLDDKVIINNLEILFKKTD